LASRVMDHSALKAILSVADQYGNQGKHDICASYRMTV
jgi:hypothetical protein